MRITHKIIIGILLVIAAVFVSVRYSKFFITNAATVPSFVRSWGERDTSYVMNPFNMAIASNGTIYVTDTLNAFVHVFDEAGTFQFKFPASGQSVAIAPDGTVYVANTANDRVDVYTSTGTKLFQFGSTGEGDGQFILPRGIGIGSDGTVYVAGGGGPRGLMGQRVQAFSPDGTFLFGWGGVSDTNSPGLFDRPGYVYVDRNDNNTVYVTDTNYSNIQVFDASGSLIRVLGGSLGSAEGELSNVGGIFVDEMANLYVADRGNTRIQIFDNRGLYVDMFGVPGSAPGEFGDPSDIKFVNEKFYVSDRGNQKIHIFVDGALEVGQPIPDKDFSSSFSYTSTVSDGTFFNPTGVATNADGTVYVADAGNSRIEVFNPTGTFIRSFGTVGTGNGGFSSSIADIALDPNGNLYVLDAGRVQIFEPSAGLYTGEFGPSIAFNSDFGGAEGLAIDANGTIYIADTTNERVQYFDETGTFVGEFAQGIAASDVAVASDGKIYVLDKSASTVYIYDSSRSLLSQFGSVGSGNGEFTTPQSLAVSVGGKIYVTDKGNNRIQFFDSAGGYLGAFGSAGFGIGEFSEPHGISISPTGNIYTTDMGNHRVQQFIADTVAAAPVVTLPPEGATSNPIANFAGIGEAGATITVEEDIAVICSAVADSSGNWSCAPAAPVSAPGAHTFSVTQVDPDMNTSPATVVVVTISGASSGGSGGGGGAVSPQPPRGGNAVLLSIIDAVTPASSSICNSENEFTVYLKRSDRGVEVKKAQRFLQEKGFYTSSLDGIFGPKTQRAVAGFQEMYRDTILAPWGLASGTGVWAQTTRAFANRLIGCPEGPIVLPNGVQVNI